MGEVIVDTKYLLKYPAQFTLTTNSSWSGRDWSVTDGSDNLVFRTESRLMESHQRTRLLDATGNEVVCFQEKPWSWSDTWNVFSGSSDVLQFSLKDARMVQTKTFMNVFLPSNTDNKNPDYKIRNTHMFGSTFNILHGTEEVAVVKRTSKWFGPTTFTVTVFPGTDHVFIFVLIIIKEIVRKDRERRRARRAANSSNTYSST